MASRPLYSPTELLRTFAPRSIAIVGVSPNKSAFGSVTHSNIVKKGGFSGKTFIVNGRYERIDSETCYRSISALPETPDCVFIAVPRDAVEPIVVECAQRGVAGVVLFSSGYSETGLVDRIEQQARLAALGRDAGMRIVGPNCVGYMNYGLGIIGTFATASFKGGPRARAIGVVSQSGAVGAALVQAMEHGVSFSHMLTCGNACDVDVADQVAYLAEDRSCSAIACVFEGMADPTRFLAAAEACNRHNKPLVVHKLGTSERGAHAALSHTGSVAGSQAAYRAAFERVGALMVNDLETLIETTSFFSKAPPPTAKGVAVAAVSGGACIMLADKAELHQIELPHPSQKTMSVLERVVPEFGSPGNPCDLTAQVLATPHHLEECLDAMLSDQQYSAMVVPHTFAYPTATARIPLMDEAAGKYGKIACNVWMTQHLEGPGVEETERSEHVALFHSMNSCMAALALWHWRGDWERQRAQLSPQLTSSTASATAARLLRGVAHSTLTERESKEVLTPYGIPMVTETLVQTADEAVVAARSCAGAVAMKVESVEIPHKTEAGVIRLGLSSDDEVRIAFDDIMANARKVTQASRINGILVQPMVKPGVEIVIGARTDAQFGPLVVVGLGGIFMELLRDTAVSLAPITNEQALAMLERLRGRQILQGFRGGPAVNLNKLVDVIVRASQFIADQHDQVVELDINPLICTGDQIIGVDALIVKRTAA
jgi:acyl-CoA synthetase (NDP forming)